MGSWAGHDAEFGGTCELHFGRAVEIKPTAWEVEGEEAYIALVDCETSESWAFYIGTLQECENALLQLAKLREGDPLPYVYIDREKENEDE